MNVFAAAESHLAQRIRRTLAGGVRRMSTRSRVITAVVLCGACAAVLPSTGIAQTRDSVDWEMARTTAPEEWSEELKSQIIAAGHDLEEIAERIRLRQQEEVARRTDEDGDSDRLAEFQRGVAARAMATPPEEWDEEMKRAIRRAGWDPVVLAERVRQARASDSESVDLSELQSGASTVIQERTWGQVKREVANPE